MTSLGKSLTAGDRDAPFVCPFVWPFVRPFVLPVAAFFSVGETLMN